MLRQASQAPEAHTFLLALQDSQPSLEEEQATHSTPSKEHARLSITVLEQVTEVRTPLASPHILKLRSLLPGCQPLVECRLCWETLADAHPSGQFTPG